MELEVEHAAGIKGGTDDGTDDDDDPWAQEFSIGGDDDPILIRRKRKMRKRVTQVIDSKETMSDKTFNAPPPPLVDDILPSPKQGIRTGDARYIAPEMLSKIYHPHRTSLQPEELRHRQGTDDPIRLPVLEIGKFLETHSNNELVASWGSMLGSPDPSLLSPQGGFFNGYRQTSNAWCMLRSDAGSSS